MKSLLENDFLSFYHLPPASVSVNVTDDPSFPVIDGSGRAQFENPSRRRVAILDYENFFKSLSARFQHGKLNCDKILYTISNGCFLLNEITDTQPKYINDFQLANGHPREGKRSHAQRQMVQTIELLWSVASIQSFVKQHPVKRCCFFNTQPIAPASINAVTAFGRFSTLAPHGYQMSCRNIEAYGFDYWEISGPQTYTLA